MVAPGGRIRIKTDALIRDTGQPDRVVPDAGQHAVQDLPEEALIFLLGSRYCETDLLSQAAWDMFGPSPPGWGRVQAICDYVHNRIAFDYQQARATRTAWEAWNECTGVCRDYAHLAIAFCRCLNIPARYCTGYLGDMGTLPPYGVGDFAAWFEAYIGGDWYTFDPRNNVPRIGRILMTRGRDACDVAIRDNLRAKHAGELQSVDRRGGRKQWPRLMKHRNSNWLIEGELLSCRRLPRPHPRAVQLNRIREGCRFHLQSGFNIVVSKVGSTGSARWSLSHRCAFHFNIDRAT
jgi:hypothetical protein